MTQPAHTPRSTPLLPATALAGLLSACTTLHDVPAEGTSPATTDMKAHEVTITRQALLPGAPQAVFDFIAAEDVLPRVLTGYGPLPAVVGTSEHTGPWDRTGSMRRVHLADGSSLREQVLLYQPPQHFAYRVWDFGHPLLARLARQGHGEWAFTEAEGGTQVRWTYTFTATGALAALPLSVITRLLWRGYMDRCLDNARTQLAGRAAG